MNPIKRISVLAVLCFAIITVFVIKERKSENETLSFSRKPFDSATNVSTESTARRPRLVDLGAGKCIPCRMMAPILDELSENYADVFEVEFIDVWEHPAAGEKYGIRMIPTQIFYDASGRELFRHEGFLGRDEILATWRAHGITVPESPEHR